MVLPDSFPLAVRAGYGRWLLLTLLLLGFVLPGQATHIVGGQLQMTYLRTGQYEMGLTLYFDAVNGSSGARQTSLPIYFYEKRTRALKDSVELELISTSNVAYTGVNCQLSSLRTDELSYIATVNLDPARYTDPGGYYVSWERCCRNGIITNIQLPGDAAQVFYLEFPALRRNGLPVVNSSPQGFTASGDYACVGSPFLVAFGGTDPDGDSLVYDLVTPLNGHARSMPNALIQPRPARPGPYQKIRWLAGFDSLQQITGPQPLTVNRQTGELAFTAGQPGLYVFALRCTEYRAGRRIGEVRREFQQVVVSCPPNPAPTLTATQLGPPRQAPVYVPGSIIRLPDPPANRCLNLYAIDGDNNSRLQLTVIADPQQPTPILPSLSVTRGTVNTNGRRDTLIATLCFDDCFGREGTAFRLAVVAEDQACPQPNRDTVWLTVQSRFIPDAPPLIGIVDSAASFSSKPGGVITFPFIGIDRDPGTRVTVKASNLQTGRLAGMPISCPVVSADLAATSRVTWPLDCNTPPGDYDVQVQVLSTACSRTLTRDTLVRVTVLPPDTTFIRPPNIFTPNADGLNDDFRPAAGILPGCGQEFRRLRIFNRWGREIFASADRMATWTGGNMGEGMYFYFLEYSDRTYKGWVELIR
jgi:gliding motility-associated-like protein